MGEIELFEAVVSRPWQTIRDVHAPLFSVGGGALRSVESGAVEYGDVLRLVPMSEERKALVMPDLEKRLAR